MKQALTQLEVKILFDDFIEIYESKFIYNIITNIY